MTSTWPWLDHLVSGLPHRTLALLRLAFAPARHLLLNLARHGNSPVHSTKGTPSPLNGLRLLVGIRFQVLFHSPPGVLFTFPSRYSSAIGHVLVFRLADSTSSSGWVPHVPRRTRDSLLPFRASPTGLSPSSAGFSHAVPLRFVLLLRSYYPARGLVWPPPVSLAATPGITFVLFSSGYSDVSLPRVLLPSGCTSPLRDAGFPIRTPPDPRSPTAPRRVSPFNASFFSGTCLRHPPYALSILIYRVFFRRLLSLRFLFLRFAFELFFPFGLSSRSILHFLVQKDHLLFLSLSVSSVIRFSKIDFPEGLLRAPSKLNSKLSCFLLRKEVIQSTFP